jgi:hypothetical protein
MKDWSGHEIHEIQPLLWLVELKTSYAATFISHGGDRGKADPKSCLA